MTSKDLTTGSYSIRVGGITNGANPTLNDLNNMTEVKGVTWSGDTIKFNYPKDNKEEKMDAVISIKDLWEVFPEIKTKDYYDWQDDDERNHAINDWKSRVVEAANWKRGKAAYKSLNKE